MILKSIVVHFISPLILSGGSPAVLQNVSGASHPAPCQVVQGVQLVTPKSPVSISPTATTTSTDGN